MKQYLIFDVNYNFSAYYSKKPSILYKMLSDVFDASYEDQEFVTRLFEQIRKEINLKMVETYLSSQYGHNENYQVDRITHTHTFLNNNGEVDFKLQVFKDFMLLEAENKSTHVVELLNDFYNKLFMVNLDDKEYHWVRDLYNVSLV